MKSELSGVSYYVSKKVGKAVWDYRMLKDDDRILIAVSGGKDSLALLSIMKDRKRFVPVRHEIIACHVDMGFEWVQTDILKDYFESQDIRYVIAGPSEQWTRTDQPPDCFWCSWNRRKTLFKIAREIGCNKLALGHHMDDITETVLLNLLFNGVIGTMRPYQELFNGRLSLIRPLAYVEEKYLTKFANQLDLPVITSRCPRAKTSKRQLVKGIITEVQKHNKNVKKNIFGSLQRIREDYLLGTEQKMEPGRF
jgi:tRNA 2-thiocytidine biosynthesis protein TtcA